MRGKRAKAIRKFLESKGISWRLYKQKYRKLKSFWLLNKFMDKIYGIKNSRNK